MWTIQHYLTHVSIDQESRYRIHKKYWSKYTVNTLQYIFVIYSYFKTYDERSYFF